MANPNTGKETFERSVLTLAQEYLQLTTAELDPYTSKKGEIETSGLEVSLYTPSHIQFARYGRGPGKRPPLDPILNWVRKGNIQFPGLSKLGTAAVIMNSIAKKGTLNWTKNAPNALDEALKKNFEQYNKKLNGTLVVLLTKQTREIYKELPIEEKFKI